MSNSQDQHSVFNFHNYCLPALFLPSIPGGDPSCSPLDAKAMVNAMARRRPTGNPVFSSEFGSGTTSKDCARAFGLADKHMVGWQVRQYRACNDQPPFKLTGPNEQSLVYDQFKPPMGNNVNHRVMSLVVRPYPLAIAGAPVGWTSTRRTGASSFATTFAERAEGDSPILR